MADLRRRGPTEASEPHWEVYDGSPEPMADGVSPFPRARPSRTRRTIGAAAGLLVAAAAGAVVAIGLAPANPVRNPAPVEAAGPVGWRPVEPSIAAGATMVFGAGEADGIVVTDAGWVATSYSRITGERRPSGEYGLSIDGRPATILTVDRRSDVAVLSAAGSSPASVARPGSPARVGETLTLLDVQGERLPTVGIAVTVTATGQTCSRAGADARPVGFRFSLEAATAEPGAALVRADGTVAGLYFGGDDATHHCAIPIQTVLDVVRTVDAGD